MRTLYNSKDAPGREHALSSNGRVKAAAFAALLLLAPLAAPARADRLRLADGAVIEVDEAWEDSQGVWYRRGGVTHLVPRSRVRAVERGPRADAEGKGAGVGAKGAGEVATTESSAPQAATPRDSAAPNSPAAEPAEVVQVYLKGGARMEVDEATESAEGVWFRRGNLSTFVERERVERVARGREAEAAAAEVAGVASPRRERRWTTGRAGLDAIIRQNGSRHGVDPYLIFLVMEHESHFNPRAVSPVGARGLMQLMPGTARRFGVRDAHDPAQNVAGGTRYLKELLKRFDRRVDLVLAGYNAGEGNVARFGNRVPPFRETRNYVRSISARYK